VKILKEFQTIAKAHVLAVENRLKHKGCRAWNIGTGIPISVLKIKETFEKVNGVIVNSEFVERRAGDLACFYADASRANRELNWTPRQLELAKAESHRLQSIIFYKIFPHNKIGT